MRKILLSSLFLSQIVFLGCGASHPAAHVIINNDSDKDLPLNLSIRSADKNGKNREINYSGKPGITQLPAEKLPAGLYEVTAGNGLVSIRKKVSLDSDRWLILNFINSDSLNIQNKYGYVDTSFLKKIDGKYTGFDMYADSRKPPVL